MDKPKKVAIGCQGGGMHAAFEVGVLTAVLESVSKRETEPQFELVGLSGTSAGALCALMVWYGLEVSRLTAQSDPSARTLLG